MSSANIIKDYDFDLLNPNTFEGDTVFECDIPSGVTIGVCDGYAEFAGDTIGDNVTITQKSQQSGSKYQFNNIVINRSSNVVVSNGDIIGNNAAGGKSGIVISANICTNVKLRSNQSVNIKSRSAGDGLNIEAGSSINLKNCGDHARLNAGSSINFDTVGSYCILDAGSSINGDCVGAYSELDAGSSINVDKVLDYCELDAGSSINVDYVYAGSVLDAGSSINVDVADPSVEMDAGSKVRCDSKKPLSSAPSKPGAGKPRTGFKR